jgi:hypothetical protein
MFCSGLSVSLGKGISVAWPEDEEAGDIRG